MGLVQELKELDLDGKTVAMGLSTAISLIKYGVEIFETLSKDLSEDQLKEIINVYREASLDVIEKMDASILARKTKQV